MIDVPGNISAGLTQFELLDLDHRWLGGRFVKAWWYGKLNTGGFRVKCGTLGTSADGG